MAVATKGVLSDDILKRCQERAPTYDQEIRFSTKDFEELRNAVYLTIAVPRELGGAGFTLVEVGHEQRRLGYHAAPTAVAINMRLYWTGLAANVPRSEDKSVEWILKAAMDKEVFAAGHSE